MKIMKITQSLLVGAMLLLLTMETVTAQRFSQEDDSRIRPARIQTGTFYSRTLDQPPFPFNPFPELAVTELQPGLFVYDDRSVDYVQLRTELVAMQAEKAALMGDAEESGSGGGTAMLMSGGGPVLQIALSGDDGRRVSFETQPGFVYLIEESTNLLDWTPLDTVVADDTNEAFFAFGPDMRFYRVIQGSDLIQFPQLSSHGRAVLLHRRLHAGSRHG